jgi:hypothetical protein
MDRRELGKMIGALREPRRIKLLVKENVDIALGVAAAFSKCVTPESAWVALSSVLELEELDGRSPASVVLLCFFRKYVFNLYEEIIFLLVERSRLVDDEGRRARETLRLMKIIAEIALDYSAEKDYYIYTRNVAADATKAWTAEPRPL